MAPDYAGPVTRSPTTVVVAAVIVLVEALAVAGFAVVELVSLDPDRPSVALTSGAFFMLYAVLLAFASRALLRLQTWSRSMIVMAQVIQLAVGWSFYGGDTRIVTWALAIPALAVLALVLSPPTTQALFGESDRGDESASDQRS